MKNKMTPEQIEFEYQKNCIFNLSVRTLEDYVSSLGDIAPSKADYCAIDSECIRFFLGRPEYKDRGDGKLAWTGNEVGRWKYGNLNNLRAFFRFDPFLLRGIFKYSLTCTKVVIRKRPLAEKELPRKPLDEYAAFLEGSMPMEADHVAVDSQRIRFFCGKPEYGKDDNPVWQGDEVGSWKYGSSEALQTLFYVKPFIGKRGFLWNRMCEEY